MEEGLLFSGKAATDPYFSACSHSPATAEIYSRAAELKVFWFFSSEKNIFLLHMAREPHMPKNDEFQRGWDAAIKAVSLWHASKAKQTLVQARRSRFPKTLESEAALHERCANDIKTLSPDDV